MSNRSRPGKGKFPPQFEHPVPLRQRPAPRGGQQSRKTRTTRNPNQRAYRIKNVRDVSEEPAEYFENRFSDDFVREEMNSAQTLLSFGAPD
jgi:hypothetical protein